MMRLIVVVEGQTEEAFVKDVLVPHLAAHKVFVAATIVGKQLAHERGHRGRGGGQFRSWRRDIARLLHDGTDWGLRVTTFFDLYGLPEDFPGLSGLSTELDTNVRCDALQRSLAVDTNDRRFIPYIQRHEFEALVLASLPRCERCSTLRTILQGSTCSSAKSGACRPRT